MDDEEEISSLEVTPVRQASFNIHLVGLNGPVSQCLDRATGRCMFAGPVYCLPPLIAPFAVYAGYFDSVCEDVIFIAFLYGDASRTTIEGEILVFHIVSDKKSIYLQELTCTEIEAMLTFNRRALHKCVFWGKIRDGSWHEDAETTNIYTTKEFSVLIDLFRKHRKSRMKSLMKFSWSFSRIFAINLRNDGVFLDILDDDTNLGWDYDDELDNFSIKKDHKVVPSDLSISAMRVYGNEIFCAFITLPNNLGLNRFLEKFCTFDPRKRIGVYDHVIGVCNATAEKMNSHIYRVPLHSKWNTTIEIEIINSEEIIMRHMFKGKFVLERNLKFCSISNKGIQLYDSVLPEKFRGGNIEYRKKGKEEQLVFSRFLELNPDATIFQNERLGNKTTSPFLSIL